MFNQVSGKRVTALFFALLILHLVAVPLFARSLFELDLGFAGMYRTDSESGFIEGMSQGENWSLGAELNLRVAAVSFTAFAMPHNGDASGLFLSTSLGFNVPIIKEFFYLGAQGGLKTSFGFPEVGEATINGNLVSETNFSEVLSSSPILFRVSLDFLIGKANLALVYYWESQANVNALQARGGWATLFQPATPGYVGVVLRLALF